MIETLMGDLKEWHLRLNFGPTEPEGHNFLTLRLPWGEDGLAVGQKHNREQRHMPLTMNENFLKQWIETNSPWYKEHFHIAKNLKMFLSITKKNQSIKKKTQKSNNNKNTHTHTYNIYDLGEHLEDELVFWWHFQGNWLT